MISYGHYRNFNEKYEFLRLRRFVGRYLGVNMLSQGPQGMNGFLHIFIGLTKTGDFIRKLGVITAKQG